MTIKIPKQKTYVRIKTRTAIIIGYIYIMSGSRIIDYVNAQVNKFIPVTEATVYSLDNKSKSDQNINGKNDIIFLNVEEIEMLTEYKENKEKTQINKKAPDSNQDKSNNS